MASLKKYLKAFLVVTAGGIFAIGLPAHGADVQPVAPKVLKVGVSLGPQQQVMEVAKKVAKEQYNLKLEVKTFADYQIPNEALASGDIDANIFQTASFLEQAKAKRGYPLVVAGETFIYPMGVYSLKYKKLTDIPHRASVAIPNDPSNQGRALILLQSGGLLTLKPNVGETPTPLDVATNPKGLKITSMNAVQVGRAAKDVDLVVLNNDYVPTSGFKPSQALLQEQAATAKPYINVIVVRQSDENKPEIKHLVAVMQTPEIVAITERVSPGAVPAWVKTK